MTEFLFKSHHLKQLSWLGWGHFTSLILSILSIKLTTSIGAYEYGRFILATSIGGLLSLSFIGPLEQGFVRYYFDYSKSEKEKSAYLSMVSSTINLLLLLLTFFSLIVILIAVLIFNQSPLFLFGACLLILFSSIIIPYSSLFNALKLRREASLIQVGEKVLIIIFLFTGTFWLTMDASSVMICIAAAIAIFFIVRTIVFNKQAGMLVSNDLENQIRITAVKKVFKFSAPFVIWGWLSWFQLNGERWVINSFLTTNDVGKYGLSISLINNSVVLMYNVLIQYLTPSVYEKFSGTSATERQKGYTIIKLSSVVTFVLFFIFSVFIYFTGSSIIHILSSKEFVVDPLLLFLLTISMGIFYAGQTFTMLGLAIQKPGAYLLPKVIAAVLSITGYVVGCSLYGVYGIVFAMCIASIIYFFSIYHINKNLLASSDVHPNG